MFQVFRSGDKETRTPDIGLAKTALYQLSYIPEYKDYKTRSTKSQAGKATFRVYLL